jgi:CheY-like chemotaxis protein
MTPNAQAKVLVIDDYALTGENTVKVLRNAGYTSELVHADYWQDASNAVSALLAKDRWDVLVFDILFPGDHFAGIWLYNDLVGRGLHDRWDHTIVYTKYVGPHIAKATEGEELVVRVFIETARIQHGCVLSNMDHKGSGRLPLINKVAELLRNGPAPFCTGCRRPT